MIKAKRMKKYLFLLVLISVTKTNLTAQDFTDVKSMDYLKNVKFKSVDSNGKYFSIILNDNSFLNIQYNVLVSNQYNSTYNFIKLPANDIFENTKEFNKKYLEKNFLFMCKTIGLSDVESLKIKQAIDSTSFSNTSKPLFVSLDLKGYDEFDFTFFNNGHLIDCSFFFQRLL